MSADNIVIECLLCKDRYSKSDVENGLYQLEPMVCSKCYLALQRQPHHISCFGKPTYITPDGKRLYGYNPNTPECARWCPDRKVCRRLVPGTSIISQEESSEVKD
jgi:hypothetical protein